MKRDLSILLFMFFLPQKALPLNYYFDAILGKDTATVNTINTPWQTITKLNKIFSRLHPGDSILFKRGETWSGAIGGTIVVSTSGSALSPIVISAYGTGNKPVISGYKALTFNAAAGSNLYRSNELLTVKYLNVVTVNGVITGMGRFPNTNTANGGYLTIDSHVDPTEMTDSSLAAIPNWTGGELVRRAENWVIARNLITTHSGNTIAYISDSNNNYASTDRFGYFIQNHRLTLDVDNEWFYSPSKILEMYHKVGQPFNVKASNLSSLLRSSRFKNITVDNIHFAGANDTAIYIGGGSKVTIQNCVVDGAMTGIITNADSAIILHDSVLNCLNNGIRNYSSGNNSVIEYNYIYKVHQIPGAGGTRDDDGIGIQSRADNTLIRHNVVKNVGCGGIWFYKKNNVIVEYNLVDTFNVNKQDIGGIYSYAGDSVTTVSGRKIRYNIVLNGMGAGFGTNDSTRSKAYGIYCDVGSFQGDIENNTVANCYGGIFTHKASNWKIRHNNLYNNYSNAIQINHENATSGRFPRNYVVTGNVMWATSLNQRLLGVSDFEIKADIDSIGNIDSNYYIRPLSNSGIILDFGKNSRSLPSWQSAHSSVHYDAHSSLSPVKFSSKTAQDSSIRFYYNATNADTTISLNGYNYIAANNVKYLQNIILKPFTSIILVKDSDVVLHPLADAYTGDSLDKDNNHGINDSLLVKTNIAADNRYSYLKFSMGNLSGVLSAKLRLYGKSNATGKKVYVSAFGVNEDSWVETGITWNNQTAVTGLPLDAVGVSDTARYYEFNVSSFVKTQFLTDKLITFALKVIDSAPEFVMFNSREKVQNPPQLVIVTPATIRPSADSYVLDGAPFADSNYGFSNSLQVKKNTGTNKNRHTYLKFSLPKFSNVSSAKLRIYGSNKTDNTKVYISAYGVTNNSWAENDITWNNKPPASGLVLDSVGVNDTVRYYELNVSNFVISHNRADTVISFVLKENAGSQALLSFNSKEKGQYPPQLLIDYSGPDSYPIGKTNSHSTKNQANLLSSIFYPDSLKVNGRFRRKMPDID